jgi:4-amino-4-deoxy-L-arabinose transferase-like glycosyltransferase
MLIRALLLLLATVVALLPTWLRADWDGTEGRRVQVAMEMLRGDNWMIPMLGGEPTWAKPPLHYWLLMVCAKWFGQDYMLLRLPAVLAVFLSSFLAGELLRRWFDATVGWIGALGIICSPLVLFVWPTAEIDPLFASLTGMSIWVLAAGVSSGRAVLVLASGLLAGLAFLQKGPPYFLFAFGAYVVWFRHRRMRLALWHFVPMALVIAAYFGPLWLWYVDPAGMLKVVNEESVGRMALFQFKHVIETPVFWLRAMFVLMPFGFWGLWKWRDARDGQLDERGLLVRMCKAAVIVSVILFTFFPARPTRYLLPNVILFTFAVSPAVAHFFRHRGAVPGVARAVLCAFGLLGSAALIAIPFVPRAGDASLGVALAAALLPLVVRSPRQVVLASLVVPVIASWTVGLERTVRWSETRKAALAAGQLLRRELDALGASADLGSCGHIDSTVLLATGLWPEGDEMGRSLPDNHWVLHEELKWWRLPGESHVLRWRLELPFRTFLLSERVRSPK